MRANIVCIVAGTMPALKNLVNDGWHQRAATRYRAILEHGLTQSKHAFDGTQVVSFLAVHPLAPPACQGPIGGVFFPCLCLYPVQCCALYTGWKSSTQVVPAWQPKSMPLGGKSTVN